MISLKKLLLELNKVVNVSYILLNVLKHILRRDVYGNKLFKKYLDQIMTRARNTNQLIKNDRNMTHLQFLCNSCTILIK